MMKIGNVFLRNAQLGEIIFSDDEKYGEKSFFSNQDFVLAILLKYNFPTKFIQRNCECKYEILYDIFINKIYNIKNRKTNVRANIGAKPLPFYLNFYIIFQSAQAFEYDLPEFSPFTSKNIFLKKILYVQLAP